jgi:glycosyltransferase involved in cell wall biosynthesis
VAHEEERVARALARVLRPEGVVVSCFPLWNGVTERLREACGAVVVYDCHDWLAGFGNVATELLAAERKAMDGADLTLFSSQTLAERWGAREPLILHNAGDPGHFGLIPWRRRERPVIGYAGALNHWFDVPAVTRAAELRPDWDFLLIGPVDAVNVNPLRKLPNVSLTGPVPYAELPQRLAGCDLALIPFKLTPLIEAVNPVKLYEYLACGLPVVSSRLPEVAALGDHVYTYAAADQMPEAIEKGLLEDSPGRREARRARVLGETWAARAEALETGVARIRTQRKP